VLGSILLNDAVYLQVAGSLDTDDFSLEKHRRIFARMKDLYERGEKIDRVTIANELMKAGQLESIDGLSYLFRLTTGCRRSQISKAMSGSSRTNRSCEADFQRAETDRPVSDRRRGAR